MKSTAWYYWEPGGVYALGPFRFPQPVTEAEARADIRNWARVGRLPRGSAVWPAGTSRVRRTRSV